MKYTAEYQSKKLKEWGAPQDTEKKLYGDPLSKEKLPNGSLFKREVLSAYSLEDLILWLGSRFDKLTFTRDGYIANGHVMRNSNSITWIETAATDSPLEAVYNLCEMIYGGHE